MSDLKQKREKTGLHDAYGTEMYTGDIFKWAQAEGKLVNLLFVVERVVPGGVKYSGGVLTKEEAYYTIIVGNIYDNPELVAQLQPLQG